MGNHGACLMGGVQDGGVLGNGDFPSCRWSTLPCSAPSALECTVAEVIAPPGSGLLLASFPFRHADFAQPLEIAAALCARALPSWLARPQGTRSARLGADVHVATDPFRGYRPDRVPDCTRCNFAAFNGANDCCRAPAAVAAGEEARLLGCWNRVVLGFRSTQGKPNSSNAPESMF